jgi:membrane carboxypeptidase/penicillin-binding protein PbpC
VAIWPPDVTRFLRSTGRAYDALPRQDPRCAADPALPGPRISSPQATQAYQARPGLPGDLQRLPLSCEAGPDTRTVYWFVNGTLLFTGGPDQTFFLGLRPGLLRISVLDDRGRSDQVQVQVLPPAGSFF